MPVRRLVTVALLLTVLLAVVAIAAAGPRPLGVSNGQGSLPPVVGDLALTTVTIAVFASGLAALYTLWLARGSGYTLEQRPRWWKQYLLLALTLAALFLLAHRHLHTSVIHAHKARLPHIRTATRATPKHLPRGTRAPQFQWTEVIVLAALAAAAAAVVFARSRRREAGEPEPAAPDAATEVALALDDSLDDLRNETDVRRAVIAAYARMERALAYAGIPRRPSEAPLEYLERALRAVAGAASVQRLTELFERAKFSRHPLGSDAKDEAIAALVAVRDEVRGAT